MTRHALSKATEPKLSGKSIQHFARPELLAALRNQRDLAQETIRRLVIEGKRVDVLAELVLGYQVRPHHLKILRHAYKNRHGMTLVFRGAGKSTMATITWCIFLIILCPNIRILIASKTKENAEGFLKEIKSQFETNERLREIFGDFVGSREWSDSQIEVKGRTIPAKEPTINTVGVGGAVASKHYDVVIADDLVDEENSRTKFQRDKMVDWYYKVLTPTLLAPDADIPFSGSLNIIGTRYHYADLYGHLSEGSPDGTGGEMKGTTLTIPVLQRIEGGPEGGEAQEVSTWEEKFPAEEMKKIRVTRGLIRFNSQMQCDCEAMKGAIFHIDDCQVIELEDVPKNIQIYMACDLMISEAESADMFANVVIGYERKMDSVYVFDHYEGQLSFTGQTALIVDKAKRFLPLRTGIETNAYQAAQLQVLRKSHPEVNAVPVLTIKDKVTRAWKLTPRFEGKRMFFVKTGNHQQIIEHMVLFPGYRYKDLFDALDMAITVATRGPRKKRASEPGLM